MAGTVLPVDLALDLAGVCAQRSLQYKFLAQGEQSIQFTLSPCCVTLRDEACEADPTPFRSELERTLRTSAPTLNDPTPDTLSSPKLRIRHSEDDEDEASTGSSSLPCWFLIAVGSRLLHFCTPPPQCSLLLSLPRGQCSPTCHNTVVHVKYTALDHSETDLIQIDLAQQAPSSNPWKPQDVAEKLYSALRNEKPTAQKSGWALTEPALSRHGSSVNGGVSPVNTLPAAKGLAGNLCAAALLEEGAERRMLEHAESTARQALTREAAWTAAVVPLLVSHEQCASSVQAEEATEWAELSSAIAHTQHSVRENECQRRRTAQLNFEQRVSLVMLECAAAVLLRDEQMQRALICVDCFDACIALSLVFVNMKHHALFEREEAVHRVELSLAEKSQRFCLTTACSSLILCPAPSPTRAQQPLTTASRDRIMPSIPPLALPLVQQRPPLIHSSGGPSVKRDNPRTAHYFVLHTQKS